MKAHRITEHFGYHVVGTDVYTYARIFGTVLDETAKSLFLIPVCGEIQCTKWLRKSRLTNWNYAIPAPKVDRSRP